MLAGSQRPSWWYAPPAVRSSGRDVVELAAIAGLYLDDWQQFVLEQALGERADGKWAAFEVGLGVSRQNGKGGILEALELGCLFLDLIPKGGLVIHSAHLFDTSIEAFLRMEALINGSEELSRRVKSVSRSHGSEGFVMRDRKRLRYRARKGSAGRGFTADIVVFDEAMDLPEVTIGSLMPTLSTRPNPQLWYTGSAVDQLIHPNGVVFSRIRARGRRGDEPSLAWFEWSLDYDSPDEIPTDEAAAASTWAATNPAFGVRISEEYVEHEYRSMRFNKRMFAVERLGVGDWPAPDADMETVIPLERWDDLADSTSRPAGAICFAVDTTPDRAHTTVAAAGPRADGLWHIEVIERQRGTGWVLERMNELTDKWKPRAWIVEGASPAASLVTELEQNIVGQDTEVIVASASDHAKACGLIYDQVVDQQSLRHLATPELDAAVRGASKRPVGDAWAWSRKSSAVDISPLVSCTLALWGAVGMLDAEPEVLVAWG